MWGRLVAAGASSSAASVLDILAGFSSLPRRSAGPPGGKSKRRSFSPALVSSRSALEGRRHRLRAGRASERPISWRCHSQPTSHPPRLIAPHPSPTVPTGSMSRRQLSLTAIVAVTSILPVSGAILRCRPPDAPDTSLRSTSPIPAREAFPARPQAPPGPRRGPGHLTPYGRRTPRRPLRPFQSQVRCSRGIPGPPGVSGSRPIGPSAQCVWFPHLLFSLGFPLGSVI